VSENGGYRSYRSSGSFHGENNNKTWDFEVVSTFSDNPSINIVLKQRMSRMKILTIEK
jgi:hypothetical protein